MNDFSTTGNRYNVADAKNGVVTPAVPDVLYYILIFKLLLLASNPRAIILLYKSTF
jgi:hypothetical protein